MHELDSVVTTQLESIYRFVFHETHGSSLAEDITHTAIIKAYKSYPRLRDKDKAVSWLWGIVRNTVKQSFARPREIPTEDILSDDILLIDNSRISYITPEYEAVRKEDILKVRRAVSYLAKSYRDVCVMFYLDELDYNTIAEKLGIPLSSVKWRLNQSRDKLREEITRMEFMEKSYNRAQKLRFNFGGYVGAYDPKLGNYDNADKALEGLLAQNICIHAYEKAKTVTELASELGVAADYIEDVLENLIETQCIITLSNKYQTSFPILDKKANEDIFGGNLECVRPRAKEILDTIFSLGEKIKEIGFYGCDKTVDDLLLMLIGIACERTDCNSFNVDKLPFKGNDKAWFILANMSDSFTYGSGVGINSSGSQFGLHEYFFYQKHTSDMRFGRTPEQKAFYSLYLGEAVEDEYLISRMLECKKIRKSGDGYEITVPVLCREKGEYDRIIEVLAPVFEITNKLQRKVYERSCDMTKKYIPKHLSEQAEFFSSYFCHTVLESAIYEELLRRKYEFTDERAAWFIVK